jgi:hypothetical protein
MTSPGAAYNPVLTQRVTPVSKDMVLLTLGASAGTAPGKNAALGSIIRAALGASKY